MARTIAKDHAIKREQIQKAAAQIFAAEGFHRTSMAQLAALCGISKANIYHYYDSKNALLFDMLENYLRNLRDQVHNAPKSPSPAQQLQNIILIILKTYRGADDLHQLQVRALSALPEAQQQTLRDYQRDMVKHISEIIRRISPETFAGNKEKLRAATMSIFGMLNWYYMWNSGAGPKAREDYAELVSNLALHGLGGI